MLKERQIRFPKQLLKLWQSLPTNSQSQESRSNKSEVYKFQGPTTSYFLDYFGLKSLKELPDIQEMELSLKEDAPLDLFFDGTNEGEQS